MPAVVSKAISNTNQWVELIAVPSSGLQYATVSINIVNRNANAATLKLAVTNVAGTTPGAADFIEDGGTINGSGGKYEYEYFILNPGEKILFQSSNSDCVARAHGLTKI
jgi:hypothetical protein